MKYLRTFILVLMTVLLPIRGAVAAVMLCPGGSETSSAAPVGGHDHHDRHAGHEADGQATATHDPAHAQAPADPSSDTHAAACPFCAGGGCCVTALAFAPPSVEGPLVTTSAAFPAITARVSVHYPDGQDRPPRTI